MESPKKESETHRNPINGALLSKSPIIIIYSLNILSPMETNSTLVIFALLAALGLVTLVAVDIMLAAQEAEAKGCPVGTPAPNASKTRCFRP
jgi:hypothetical protein